MLFKLRASTVFFAMLLGGVAVSAQTVTESNLLAVAQKTPDLAIQAIGMAKKIDIDLSFEHLTVLLNKGVPQKVLDALIARKDQLDGKQQVLAAPVAPSDRAAAAPANPPTGGCPGAAGVYYHSPSGEWVEIEPIMPTVSTPKVKIMKVAMSWVFPGAEAPVKVQGPNAEFCFRNMGVNLRNLTVAVLKKNRNSREVEYSSVGNLGSGNRSPKNFKRVNASKLADDLIMVTLNDLEDDGNFAFDLIQMPQYDFTVRAAKRP